MPCGLVVGGPPGCSEPEQIGTSALSLPALWDVAFVSVWVCPGLWAGRDGKTSLVDHWAAGAPHHGPEGKEGGLLVEF